MTKVIKKIIATMLLISLTCINFIFVGSYFTGEVIAMAENSKLESQEIKTNNKNVEFDAYFIVDENRVHSMNADIDATDAKMYLRVKVLEGYLKNAQINFSNTNFEMSNQISNLQLVQSIDTKNNIIQLNPIEKGMEVELEIPITAKRGNPYEIGNLSMETTVKLEGDYITEQGEEDKVSSEIKTFLHWTGEINSLLSQEIVKYIPFENENQNGVLIQTAIKSKLDNGKLPIKQTDVYITVPTIEGKLPDNVGVVIQSTEATNGNDKTQTNYEYNKENSQIHIVVTNNEIENKVAWEKSGEDEYLVTYLFLLEKGSENPSKIDIKAQNEITAYTNAKATRTIEETIILEKEIGSAISGNVQTNPESLYKGAMYAASNYETEYEVESTINIIEGNLAETILIENKEDIFILKDGTEIEAGNNTYYKQTKINKEDFEKVLGTEGKIYIYNEQDILLGIIDKNSDIDENGNYFIDYSTKPTKLRMQTTDALGDVLGANIQIIQKKAISAKTTYDAEQIKNIEKLKVIINTEGIEDFAEIELKETENKADIKLNNNIVSLSTMQANSIEILATLKTSDIRYELSNSPILEIVLSKEFKNVTVGELSLLNEDELKIENKQVSINENGETVITIRLNGKQTVYKMQDTTLLIPVQIPDMKTIPSKTVELKAKYTDSQTQKLEEKTIKLELVSKYGLFTLNQIDEGIFEENVQTVLPAKTERKTITIKQKIINNYEDILSGITILGRIPSLESKDQNGNYIGSEFDSVLKQNVQINSENAKIYYSEDTGIEKDAEGWKENVTDFSNIKSFKIVLENYEMPQEAILDISYIIEIEENLDYNKKAYAFSCIDYIYEGQNKQSTSKIELATETVNGSDIIEGESKVEEVNGLKLETMVKSGGAILKEQETVYTGQIVKYIAKITNTTDQVITGISYEAKIPEGTTFVEVNENYEYEDEYYTEKENVQLVKAENIEIPANGSINVQFEVRAKEQGEIYSEIKITKNNITSKAQTIKNKVEEGKIQLTIRSVDDESIIKQAGDGMALLIDVENLTEETLKDVIVRFNNPQGITYKKARIVSGGEEIALEQYNSNNTTGEISWKIDQIAGKETKKIYVDVRIDDMDLEEQSREFNFLAKVTESQNKTYTSNEYEKIVYQGKTKVTVVKTTNNVGPVKHGDEIVYTISIKNEGKVDAKDIRMTERLSEGLEGISISYTNFENTEDTEIPEEEDDNLGIPEDNFGNPNETDENYNHFDEFGNIEKGSAEGTYKFTEVTGGLYIPSGETLVITVKARVNLEGKDNIEEVSNLVTVAGINIDETSSNEVATEVEQTTEPGGEDTDKTYKIAGTAWVDANQNGIRETEEDILGNVPVKLYDGTTDTIVKETITNEDGKYEFTDLAKGRYIVIFEYDVETYNVTAYQVAGVSKRINSDVIVTTKQIEGQERTVAATDIIEISNSDEIDIDMGLYVKPKFDLALNKTINKITVQNKQGTKTYEYSGEKLAKIELVAKYITGTNIIVEYNLAITNEGNVTGYVSKLVDILPDELRFSSDLNPDWYMTAEGELHNLTLEKQGIEPGETIDIALVLTKAITEDDTGVIANLAEIGDSYCVEGMEEYDSIQGNKNTKEDDFSTAELIISIKTGQEVFMVTIIIISLIVFTSGVILIKKKVLG